MCIVSFDYASPEYIIWCECGWETVSITLTQQALAFTITIESFSYDLLQL
jgi:hypothetical protein